ncbi:MAG: LamG domain-containing protein, partial [Candidatus Thorarchaeota archaeon]
MRKSGLVGILFVVLFLLPVTSPNVGPVFSTESLPPLTQYDEGYSVSDIGDLSSGTGLPLDVNIGGVVSNEGEGSYQITSGSSGSSSVTIEDGWTGSNLNAEIDTLTMVAEDVLNNGDFDDTHNELFIVTDQTTVNDNPVLLPDGWTLVKDVPDDNPHPTEGAFHLASTPSGYGSTYGVRMGSTYTGTFDHVLGEEIYISQMVSIPWREVYSVTISFRYFVESSSDLEDQVNLFIRIGRVTREFHVFESGDPTDTWLTETRTILASSMSDLSSYAIQFDIGLTSDQEGQGNANSASVRIDDVKADFTVRPFPEQVDLKANGTLVWGSTSGSVYPYVPDDANRDCYDTASSGLDLDGYGNDGGLGVGMYSTGYDMGTQFDAAFQFPVDIPNGAIITSAHFEVEATMGSASYMPGMRLSVADLSNMTAFTAGGGSLEERYSWLDTSIDWTVNSWLTTPVTRYNSPDMAPLIQKVVSNSSWVSGNYLCVMAELMYTSSDQNWNDLKGSSHYDGTHLARLFVEYVIPENDDTIIFFDYQKDITIDYTKVAATLTDFPVMIDLIDTDLKTKVLSGGNDIVFTIDGQPVAHEIELFNQDYSGSEAHLVAWLKVPTLSSTTDTVITMHYGCANAPAAYSGKVWDDYSIVQHLNDDPSGIQYDSTSNNYDGTSYGGLSTTDLVTGKIGDAIDFDGSDDMISVGQIFTDDWSEFTISVWVNHDGFYDDRIFSKAPSTTVSSCIVHLAVDDTGTERVRLSTDGVGGSAATSLDSIATPSNLNWHYLTFSWSAVTQTIWLYVDGSPDTSYFKDGDSIDDSDVMFVIANWGAQFDNTRHWHGLLDEIRMLPIALTDEWIETEFNNQDDPSNFYSVGSETSVAETWTDEGDTRIVFTTSSLNPITLQTYITMDISGEGQTLDESLDPGTSYFIESGSTIVNWTAKVMVSPPAGATSMGFSVEYPMAEWKPTTVLNPFNDPKTDPQDWWHQAGTLTINASSIDFWGIWTLKFISWNFVDDVTMGRSGEALGTTATFNIGDSMKFLATTPTLNGATVGFVLTDPTDTVTYTGTNTTGTTPTHKFPSFEYRKDFTINPANVHDDVTNFPVALDFTDTDLHDPTKVRDDGSDIMFAQGDVILAHDIEYFVQDYDIVNAWLVAWVSANLSSSVTSTITMYYGSPVVDNLEDPDGVWGSDYDAVWHMGETVTDEGSGSIHYDSTTSNYDGIQNGNDETLTSRIGYAQNFDGNDYIAFDETLTPPDDVMISGWFRITETHDSSDNTQVLMEKYLDADRNMVIALAGSDYGHGSVPAGSLVFKVESQTGSAIYKWTTRTTWTAGWYYIACQADEDSPTSNQIFVGFASAGWDTDAASSGGSADANMSYVEEWRLGGGNYETGSGSNDAYFTGQMDEWRVGSTHQSLGWLQTEWANQQNPTGFAQRGSEIARSSPDHTFTQSLGTTAPAGVWTVSAYYNDTGTSVSTRTGLFERTFTVKRDTTLTLTKPTDAVGDRLSVKTAGDAIIIEFELEDSLNSQPIAGATVTMNWTSPVTVTLDDYGGGVYGKVLDTDDLADAKEYRIEVDSTHPYYNDASEYFNIELNHNTELDYSDVSTTPVGEDFTVTVTFTDTYTGSPITDAIITFGDNSPVQSFTHEGGGDYSVTISSTALSPGDHQFILKAQSANNYLYSATVSVTFELRAHYTAISVTGDFLTPNGVDTDVTVVLIDFDTGLMLDASVVTSFTFTSSQGIQVESATFNLDAALDTDSWAVGVYSINVTMIMSDSDYYTPQLFTFTVEIRPHYTALTVSGSMNQPYGNTTPLEIHLTDLDTGVDLTSSIVTNFNFAWQGDDYDHGGGGSLIFNLDTSTWSVGATTVTVTTTMSSSLYYEPANYQFDITIRSMDSLLYTRPPASALYPSLVFPSGVDFEVYLQLNVSELGTYYGDAIIGRIAGEFSVSAFTIKSVDVSEAAIGRYKISIDASNFGDGAYELVFYFTSNDDMYGDTFIVIRFSYRPIISYLTSPNYPQVITPYLMDVQISLNYTDADFGTGIEGATVSSPDHPTWLYGAFDHTGGLYTVWIDVSSLTQGTYNISITLDKPLYDAKTLQFRIVVREAYTSVLPSVGSLDIPLGSSISFYVDYTDIDRFIPIDNSTSDTEVECLSWTNFDVVYVSGLQKYQITFYTTDSDPISQNVIHTFTFSKGTNYQVVSFNISVSIRTHNTDFRIVSAIEPTTTIGTFNISVYYGDLDDGIGINSVDVDFWVENTTGVVSSSYDFDVLGDGYYIISVPASQFGLGLQDFTVYADWTAAIAKYQDKSFVTSANVVGRVSALTLLIAADPTPYNEDMSYTFFFSDTGTGISNLTGNVFITVSFQGETVNPADITIIDWSLTQPGNYSIEFNTGIFSRIGVIYMDISVEWAKGVAPYYSNRTDTVSVRVLQRDTLLQVSPPSPTNYGEIAAFNFTFDDITGEPDVAITDD